ncbi:hypothetical protein [Tenacibaculum ovolyticum]|uniref:hypothetical protein n=1 Tax=Tenacibaculum ovolyticum TaxID=104270 RepID=UPI001F3DBB85|nr:hypothetical protein [Tenacibaculum ovolyticum]
MKIKRIVSILIIIFTTNIASGQATDSLKNAMFKKIRASERFKENIYDFKGKELPKFELNILNGK